MTSRRVWAAAFGALGVIFLLAGPARAQSGVALSATLGGSAVAGSKDSRPVPLSAQATDIDLRVTNNTSAPVSVHTVRLWSSVLGVNFFTYETAVEIDVAPGATEERKFSLDLSALKGQATGLLPASISVLDANRHVLASEPATVDVHGRKLSVYGIFGLVLLILTGLALLGALLGLAHHTLSENRWLRGVRFLIPGIGVGLVLVIGASVFGAFSPRLSRWGPIVIITAVAMFVVGYLTPSPEPDYEDHSLAPEAGVPAMPPPAPATPPPAPATPPRAPATPPAVRPAAAPPAAATPPPAPAAPATEPPTRKTAPPSDAESPPGAVTAPSPAHLGEPAGATAAPTTAPPASTTTRSTMPPAPTTRSTMPPGGNQAG